ncbi:hypothetical protein N7478_007479 [Penicillium angulare]|uniref:uncharacterized protein n=1 Tax=Penicillium angulare TaxID=116970 RepID=UPI0025408D98|nr:uncharacterized protein N7478_007479 [Penicillium angulare]KAJ5272354.1 hypothetical protein N7478_007479 [Penicillium angulare]
MSWSRIFSRPPHESGSTGSSRVFIYLGLAAFSLLLAYQLVLNHDTVGAIAPWRSGLLAGTPTDDKKHATDGWAGSAMNGTLQEAVEQAGSSSITDSVPFPTPAPESESESESESVPAPAPEPVISSSPPSSSLKPNPNPKPKPKPEIGSIPITKELVVAAMSYSNMSWVEDNVPDWKSNIYRADMPPGEAQFTVPENRGNEAMVYLTYLIDRYDSLPDVIVLVHGGRYQWHNDNPLYDSVVSIKDLQLHYVQKAGYVNLRCTWAIGCPAELEPARYFRERPDDRDHPTAMEFPDQFQILFPGEELPEVIGVPCCSQFAVSKEAVRRRSKGDYIRMQRWLLESPLDAATSGRILEYAWHIMFGQVPQLCLDARECYCNTYGYCDLDDDSLANQWVWRGMVLPPSWPNPEPEPVSEPVPEPGPESGPEQPEIGSESEPKPEEPVQPPEVEDVSQNGNADHYQ